MEDPSSSSSKGKGKMPRLSANAAIHQALFSLIANKDSMTELKSHTAALVQGLITHALEKQKAAAAELEVTAAKTAMMQLELELINARKQSSSDMAEF